jgi:hypothetical protein
MQYPMGGGTPADPMAFAVQPLAATSGDWCSGLFLPGKVTFAALWHDAPRLTSGTASYNPDHTYVTSLVFTTPGTTHFDASCLQSGGTVATCGFLQDQLNSYYTMESKLNVNPYHNLVCQAGTSQGSCDCFYTYEVDLLDKGVWTAGNGILTQKTTTYEHNGSQVDEYAPVIPIAAQYCGPPEGGNSLTLTGDQGASLSNVLGLRTLKMVKAQPPADGGM